jgi:hypothetical protein
VANDISLLDLQLSTEWEKEQWEVVCSGRVVRLRGCRQPRLWKPGINRQAYRCQVAIRAETFGEQVSVWSARGPTSTRQAPIRGSRCEGQGAQGDPQGDSRPARVHPPWVRGYSSGYGRRERDDGVRQSDFDEALAHSVEDGLRSDHRLGVPLASILRISSSRTVSPS